jgi:hypothetical protein
MSGLPAALRPAWSSSSFLAYTGALTVLVALVALLGDLGNGQGSWALAGWSLLALTILLALTARFEREERPVLTGLTAFVAIAITAVLAGSFLAAIGLGDGTAPFDDDFELAPLLVEIVVLAAALAAARRFRFPLLLLAATVAQIVLVLDLIAGILGGGNWLQWGALLLGLVELGIARSLDADPTRRTWAFWKHVAASLLIGVSLLTLLDWGDVGWVLIAIAALAYVGLGHKFRRSVWAVVGALGLFVVVTHFVDGATTLADVFPIVPVPSDGDGLETWQTALIYAGLGCGYVALGKLLREPTLHGDRTA